MSMYVAKECMTFTLVDAEAKAQSRKRSRESSARYRVTNKEKIAEDNEQHREQKNRIPSIVLFLEN